jgi:hypothetical protein
MKHDAAVEAAVVRVILAADEQRGLVLVLDRDKAAISAQPDVTGRELLDAAPRVAGVGSSGCW